MRLPLSRSGLALFPVVEWRRVPDRDGPATWEAAETRQAEDEVAANKSSA